MRTRFRLVIAAALSAIAFTAVAPAPAFAVAPAPSCESGNLMMYCEADSPTATTWTLVFKYPGNPETYVFTTPGSTINSGCAYQVMVDVSYSYTIGGVTTTSRVGKALCRSGPWP